MTALLGRLCLIWIVSEKAVIIADYALRKRHVMV
ncbi:MAG: hypothetical protein RLZZ226_1267 [Pseudomonadota bacterium]|jgi:hypothetical protein